MKTILIFNEVCEEIKFRVVDGDYSHLNNQYLNTENDLEPTIEEELNRLLLYPEGHKKAWDVLDDFTTTFPTEIIEQNPGQCKVVVVGIVP